MDNPHVTVYFDVESAFSYIAFELLMRCVPRALMQALRAVPKALGSNLLIKTAPLPALWLSKDVLCAAGISQYGS